MCAHYYNLNINFSHNIIQQQCCISFPKVKHKKFTLILHSLWVLRYPHGRGKYPKYELAIGSTWQCPNGSTLHKECHVANYAGLDKRYVQNLTWNQHTWLLRVLLWGWVFKKLDPQLQFRHCEINTNFKTFAFQICHFEEHMHLHI